MGCYIKNLNPKDSIVFSFKCHLNTVTCQYTYIFLSRILVAFLVSILFFCDFATFSHLNMIVLWLCYLFSFEYDSAVTLLPFLVSILFFCDFATFSHLNMIVLWLCYLFLFQYYIYFCDFATFSCFNIYFISVIVLPFFFLGIYIFVRKGSKMFDMIWFLAQFSFFSCASRTGT